MGEGATFVNIRTQGTRKTEVKPSNFRDKVHHTRTREEATSAEEATLAEEYISAKEDTLLEAATKATKRGQERTKKKKKLKSPRSPSIDGIKRSHQINNFWYFHRRLETGLQNGKRKDFRKFQNTKKELSVARKF